MAKFFGGKGAQKLDAPLNLLRRFSKGAELFLIGSIGCGRIGNTPVSDFRLAGKDGTRFLCPIADGDDDVEMGIFKFVPRLAAGIGWIDLVLLSQHLKRQRIDDSCRLASGAVGLEPILTDLFSQVLGKNTPGGIAGAKK